MNWFKKLLSIVKNHDSEVVIIRKELSSLRSRAADMENLIRVRTDIGVDINFKSHNHVIVVGRYKNVDYIQTYSLDGEDFSRTIEQLKELEKFGTVRTIDAPPQLRAVTSCFRDW